MWGRNYMQREFPERRKQRILWRAAGDNRYLRSERVGGERTERHRATQSWPSWGTILAYMTDGKVINLNHFGTVHTKTKRASKGSLFVMTFSYSDAG